MSTLRLRTIAIWLVCLSGGFGGGMIGMTGSVWAGEGHRPGVSHASTPMQHGKMELGDIPAPPPFFFGRDGSGRLVCLRAPRPQACLGDLTEESTWP